MIKSSLNRTTYIVILIILLGGLSFPNTALAQPREYLLKAGYIEKFTHFIEWHNQTNLNDSTDTFSIAVFGDNKFDGAFEKIFNNLKIKNKTVRISYISSFDEINGSKVLFIAESEKNKLQEILKHTAGKQILTISDTKGFGNAGVIINMLIDKNYIRYEINIIALNNSGLKVSSLLLNSAIIIK